ncbi:MAG: aspartate kinase [Eubacterium sp.]|nr:aspartate kinase [Eubacterium sp.]
MGKVVKFGGSSLATSKQFEKVLAIIREDADRRYVVPSAPGKRYAGDTKVTDLLYSCFRQANKGQDFSETLLFIRERYEEIVQGLGLSLNLDDEFETIRMNLAAGSGEDYAASRGEYLNGIVMAACLDIPFVDAADVILFNEDGELDARKTDVRIAARLEDLPRAVIPGFYGAKPDGTIKTFSRGGSDITGSLVAKAVHADLYENWTDVSGFLMADPRIVKDPVPISTITYREMRELSYMGASVLHEDSVFPLIKEGIPINVRNTNHPEDPGTMVVENTCNKPRYTITGIGGKKGFVSVTIEKAMMNTEVGFGRRVLQVFEEQGMTFEHTPSGIDTFSILVNQRDFEPHEQKIIAGLHRSVQPDMIELEPDMSLIAVVGRGMRRNRGTAGRIFSALSHAHVNVKMIDQGSSELNVIIGVENRDFEAAIRAIYAVFVSSEQ